MRTLLIFLAGIVCGEVGLYAYTALLHRRRQAESGAALAAAEARLAEVQRRWAEARLVAMQRRWAEAAVGGS